MRKRGPMNSTKKTRRMTLRVVLREYLLRLQVAEFDKPLDQRRTIPTIADIARAAGVSRAAMSYLASGKANCANLTNLAAAVEILRLKGFNTELMDLFVIENLPPIGGWEEREDNEEPNREGRKDRRRVIGIPT